MTPVTALGKMFGGIVMLFGLCVFALPAPSSPPVVVIWSMVPHEPLFSTLDAAKVAEVTKLLCTRAFQPGALIVSIGEPGGAMYLLPGLHRR